MRSRGDYAWRCGDWRVGTAQGRYAGVAGARDGSPVLRSRCARLAGCHGACLSQRPEAALGVLVVIGRAERHALTPRPSTPASPVTTTTPPAPLAARIRVGRGVAAVA